MGSWERRRPHTPRPSLALPGHAGAVSGLEVRLDGALPAAQGMPAGDILLQFVVAPSPVFEREDMDLYVTAEVDMADAALGSSIT